MRKICELATHFATGEATVQPVLLWGTNGKLCREKLSRDAYAATRKVQLLGREYSVNLLRGLFA